MAAKITSEQKLRRINNWTDKSIVEELNILHNSRYIISHPTLRKLKRYDLQPAILRRRPISYYRAKMGLPVKKKVNWTKEKIKGVQTLKLRLNHRTTGSTIHLRKGYLMILILKKMKKCQEVLNEHT